MPWLCPILSWMYRIIDIDFHSGIHGNNEVVLSGEDLTLSCRIYGFNDTVSEDDVRWINSQGKY